MEQLIGKSIFNRKEKIFGTVESILSNGNLKISMPEGRLKSLRIPLSQIGNTSNTVHMLIWADGLNSNHGRNKGLKKGG